MSQGFKLWNGYQGLRVINVSQLFSTVLGVRVRGVWVMADVQDFHENEYFRLKWSKMMKVKVGSVIFSSGIIPFETSSFIAVPCNDITL